MGKTRSDCLSVLATYVHVRNAIVATGDDLCITGRCHHHKLSTSLSSEQQVRRDHPEPVDNRVHRLAAATFLVQIVHTANQIAF